MMLPFRLRDCRGPTQAQAARSVNGFINLCLSARGKARRVNAALHSAPDARLRTRICSRARHGATRITVERSFRGALRMLGGRALAASELEPLVASEARGR